MPAVPTGRVRTFAAHAILEIVGPLEGVLHDGPHRIVQLGEQQVALAQIDLALVCLGPRLIEALLEIVAVEHDEIHDRLEGNANALAFFHLPRRPAVHPYGLVMQCFHWLVSSITSLHDSSLEPEVSDWSGVFDRRPPLHHRYSTEYAPLCTLVMT